MHEIVIYDLIGTGEGFVSASDVKSQLDELEAQGSPPVKVSVHTKGGCVIEGSQIFRLLEAYEGEVTTDIVNAISIGSVIGLAGEKRIMAANGRIMVHYPRTDAEDATADELENKSKLVRSLEDEMVQTYQQKTGLDEEVIRSMCKNETWLEAEDALKLGFIDEIGPEMAVAAKMDLSEYKNFCEPVVGSDSISEPTKEGDPVSNVLTVKGLKAKFPKASDGFIVKAMEEEATEDEATAMYVKSMEDEHEQLKAEYEELQAKYTAMKEKLSAMEEETTALNDDETTAMEDDEQKVTARATVVPGVKVKSPQKDYGELFRAKVDEIQSKRRCDRVKALKIASARFPELREQMVAQANV